MYYGDFSKKVLNLFKNNAQHVCTSHFDHEGGTIQAELSKIELNGPFLEMIQKLCVAANWYYLIKIEGKFAYFRFADIS